VARESEFGMTSFQKISVVKVKVNGTPLEKSLRKLVASAMRRRLHSGCQPLGSIQRRGFFATITLNEGELQTALRAAIRQGSRRVSQLAS